VLVAGAVGTDQLVPGGRDLAPVSPTPTRPGFPTKLATYTPKGSAEAAVLRLLTHRSDGLGACKGGQPGDVRIIATGPLPGRQGVWMIVARALLPNEQRLCWMFAFGNERNLGAPVAHLGEPPPLTLLVASGSADPSKLVIDGYVTKQAARVRLIRTGGKPPLDLEPLPSGSDVPVNFFVAVVPWRGFKGNYPVERLIALDHSGRVITSCWIQAGSPLCGSQR
ncbi:MAG TPA: hypothetical protein VJ735_13810, partial [Actinomycetes bacterium]|nr:hypothetical protein [Actinomycetes bacterium]